MARAKKSNMLITMISIVVLAAASAVYLLNDNSATEEHKPAFKQVGAEKKFDYDSQAYFYSNGTGSFFFCTKDGISYENSEWHAKWNEVYSLAKPVVKAEKDYVAVSEIKGRVAYVFNTKGFVFSKQFDYPILNFELNNLGYLCVIIKKDSGYETLVYNNKGETLCQYVHQSDNVFPISAVISNDGKVVATNLLKTDELNMVSNLNFSYISGNSEKVLGARTKDNQLVGRIKFMEDNTLIAVSDQEISTYASAENNYLRDISMYKLGNKLNYFDFLGDKGVAFVLGQRLLTKSAGQTVVESENTIKIFNSLLIETGSYNFNNKITYFSAGINAVIIGSYSNYSVINSKGNLLWEFNVPNELKQALFLGNTDTVLLVSNTEARIIKRGR